jgi:hypothetical protein
MEKEKLTLTVDHADSASVVFGKSRRRFPYKA